MGKTGIFKVAGTAKTHRSDMPGAQKSAMFFNGSKKKRGREFGIRDWG